MTADEAAALIEAIAASRDKSAFAALYRHFAPRVRAFLVRGAKCR
jgi:RNA polymerase sigma-70 factor (ECF subfamily)